MKTLVKLILPSALFLQLTNEGGAQSSHKYATEDWPNFSRYENDNQTAAKGAVVFMGDSITEGWANKHPDFFKENGYLGRGIGGQTTSQMLVRFRADVINLRPRAVLILAGTNDIAQNTGYITLENILGNIVSMTELARANGIRPILCSVLPAYEIHWNPTIKEPADLVIALNTMIRSYAEAEEIPYLDYHSALKDERNGLPPQYAPDGVHPTPAAYDIMERLAQALIESETTKKASY